MRRTRVWGHRGASGYAPENTLEAFLLAVEQGADGVELDVQMSKDKELVVIHDETVTRVSGVKGYVKDFTLQELKALNVSLPIKGYQPTQIPTLREVLEALKPTNLEVNIELKTGLIFYPGIERKVLHLVQELGMENRIWISSFNHASVLRTRSLCNTMRCGFLLSDVIIDVAAYAKKNHIQALHPGLNQMQDPEFIHKAKLQDLKVHVWTVNTEEDMRALTQAGVDALITNYPDRARRIVDEIATTQQDEEDEDLVAVAAN